ELEAKIASATDRALGIELETFERLAATVTAAAAAIKDAAEALAVLDVATALAQLAVERRYVRPQIDASLAFGIQGGRHPAGDEGRGRRGGRAVWGPPRATSPRPPRARTAASISSLARTWRASRPICARTR